MIGRTPAEAARQLREAFAAALSTVCSSPFITLDGHAPERPHILAPPGGQPLQLNSSEGLRLRFAHLIRLVPGSGGRERWRTSSLGYFYAIVDQADQELLAFHWHPHVPGMAYPHLHIGPAAQLDNRRLSRAHVPTGRIAIEDVARFALRDLGVIAARDDWDAVLTEGIATFREHRTWA